MKDDQEVLGKIGERLKELRVENGWSSHENFAFDNEMSRAHYWKIERGKTNVTIKTLMKILNVHKVSIVDFFAGLED